MVVGSDRHGTVYGVYEPSKQIGVSPWYFGQTYEFPERTTNLLEMIPANLDLLLVY